MKVDISALLGGDIYAMLRDRSAKAKSRFSKERDDDRALKERQNCLIKLQKRARHSAGSAGGAAVARRNPRQGRGGAARAPGRASATRTQRRTGEAPES